jgi:hypothetical protein
VTKETALAHLPNCDFKDTCGGGGQTHTGMQKIHISERSFGALYKENGCQHRTSSLGSEQHFPRKTPARMRSNCTAVNGTVQDVIPRGDTISISDQHADGKFHAIWVM